MIEEIIGLAMRSTSSMNVQPWNVYVVTGEPLDKIRVGATERKLARGAGVAGVPHRRGALRRQTPRPPGGRRQTAVLRRGRRARRRGFRPFDAPVCIIVTYDRDLHGMDDAPFDCGDRPGQRRLVARPGRGGQQPVVREFAGVADDQVIMKSIALGWPDETFPANAVVFERKSVAEATFFVGFDN
jgi:nitroreductase